MSFFPNGRFKVAGQVERVAWKSLVLREPQVMKRNAELSEPRDHDSVLIAMLSILAPRSDTDTPGPNNCACHSLHIVALI